MSFGHPLLWLKVTSCNCYRIKLFSADQTTLEIHRTQRRALRSKSNESFQAASRRRTHDANQLISLLQAK